jgi:predicted XRE-type DNA-binding protein
MTRLARLSKGHVFRELGFDVESSEILRIKSDLMIELSKLIEKQGWTQAQAARVMGVTQPRISNLVCGRIDLFSIDTLIAMLDRAGVRVEVVTSPEVA